MVSPHEIYVFVEELKKQKQICFDTETTSLNIQEAELVGISISDKENTGFYIPVKGLESKQLLKIELVIEVLNPILADKSIRKCGQKLYRNCCWFIRYVKIHFASRSTLLCDLIGATKQKANR